MVQPRAPDCQGQLVLVLLGGIGCGAAAVQLLRGTSAIQVAYSAPSAIAPLWPRTGLLTSGRIALVTSTGPTVAFESLAAREPTLARRILLDLGRIVAARLRPLGR